MDLAGLGERSARTAIAALRQEYPNAPRHTMRSDDDQVTPRGAHPAFYGCFDWHSAVEMHWAVLRLLRAAPTASWADEARTVLDEHLTEANLAAEATYLTDNPTYERPYGWGWLLQLADALADWDDPDAQRWSDALAPVAAVVTESFIGWLPRPAYPDRTGMHGNTAFSLDRALPWARRCEPRLLAAIEAAAQRWYGGDADYPARYEPSGADFLSPFLTEAVLMGRLLSEDFADWWRGFAPDGLPANLSAPAVVTDPSDGQGAHLHGLNLYRVHAFRELHGLVDGDLDRALDAAATAHSRAGSAALDDPGWMAEHWLTAYGVLAYG